MKKWVFGCLGLLVIVGGGAGVAGYYFLYRPAQAYMASFAQLRVIPDLEKQVSNQTVFAPPTGGQLNQDRVGRFVATQQAIFERMGTRVDELNQKYRTLRGDHNRQPSLGEAVAILKDLAGLVVDAKRTQVEALNAQGFSLSEYEWTRARVYEAVGVPIDTTLQQVIRDAASGRMPDAKPEPAAASPVPPKNIELVAPHARLLKERVALAFFGL